MQIVNKYFPNKKLHLIHTYDVGILIYSLILNLGKVNSYLELGMGSGGGLLWAGMALKHCQHKYNLPDYQLYGIDVKKERLEEARKLLTENNIKYTIIDEYSEKVNWDKRIDVLFVDCATISNQDNINKYGPFVNHIIIVHDVLTGQKLNFPEGFAEIRFPVRKLAIAFKIFK